MKNSTILKDELSLLRSDKSAVITELRLKTKELKNLEESIFKLELKREGVRSEIINETARLDDICGRAVSVKDELNRATQDLKNIRAAIDVSKTKNAQEIKLHLGRIKDLEEKETEITESIDDLKVLFDRNSKVYTELESERNKKLREIDSKIESRTKELNQITDLLSKAKEEEKKQTKERLKREDKIRARERNLEAKELSIVKKEEDLIAMSKDMSILYLRLKEVYAQVHPEVDLDKLITVAK